MLRSVRSLALIQSPIAHRHSDVSLINIRASPQEYTWNPFFFFKDCTAGKKNGSHYFLLYISFFDTPTLNASIFNTTTTVPMLVLLQQPRLVSFVCRHQVGFILELYQTSLMFSQPRINIQAASDKVRRTKRSSKEKQLLWITDEENEYIVYGNNENPVHTVNNSWSVARALKSSREVISHEVLEMSYYRTDAWHDKNKLG